MSSKSRTPTAAAGKTRIATYETDQQCEHPDCETILSRYNDKQVCAKHDPARSPRFD